MFEFDVKLSKAVILVHKLLSPSSELIFFGDYVVSLQIGKGFLIGQNGNMYVFLH